MGIFSRWTIYSAVTKEQRITYYKNTHFKFGRFNIFDLRLKLNIEEELSKLLIL